MLIDAHVWIMVTVWMLFVPLAIGVAIYGRHYKKHWWAKAHMMIMGFFVAIPMTIAATLGIVATNGFLPRAHLILGTIIVLGAWFQIGLGVVNHIIFRIYGRAQEAERPVQNKIHVGLGRILSILALINIPLGMHMRHVGLPWYIGYAIWAILLCSGSVGLFWKISYLKTQKERHGAMMITEEKERLREEDVDKTIVEQHDQPEKK
ncbi:hypothetical protein BDC45DRAFT_563393 [Circinella umbellata]|nr:hypothetical protein BDC45DRAFT_563393 [Circinella umbellata]